MDQNDINIAMVTGNVSPLARFLLEAFEIHELRVQFELARHIHRRKTRRFGSFSPELSYQGPPLLSRAKMPGVLFLLFSVVYGSSLHHKISSSISYDGSILS
jgi:hypothetical protein